MFLLKRPVLLVNNNYLTKLNNYFCTSATVLFSSKASKESKYKLNWKPRLAVVGSGPAALYASQYVLKNLANNCYIDVYEKLPVPFGLIRYGVAPDHQEVKNVINTFTDILKQENVQFYGNVNIGSDELKINELLDAYDSVILAYGSGSEKFLDIPNEKKFKNIIAAKDFVGWYNGFPENKHLELNLKNVEHAIIIGAGNVAVDIARILLSSIDKLKQTDISNEALVKIQNENNIKQVSIVARRSLLNAAFTLKELRELTKLNEVETVFNLDDFKGIENIENFLSNLDRPRKRLIEYMYNLAVKHASSKTSSTLNNKRRLNFVFLHKPIEFLGNNESGMVSGVKFKKVDFKFDTSKPYDLNLLKFNDTNETVLIDSSLIIRSIGYKNVNIDSTEIPFDKDLGIIPNDMGRVLNKNGLYCTGWIKRGPKGVIVDTTSDAHETAHKLCNDLKESENSSKIGSEKILNLLKSRNIRVVDKDGWLKIDNEEVKRGKLVGKPREKLNSIDEMLKVAFS